MPPLPLDVIIARTEEQADRIAFGAPDGRRAPLHGAGRHVIYGGYFAERRFEREGQKSLYDGAGVGVWNSEILHGDAFGVHSARLAYALSWVDAVDPCPKAEKAARKKGPGPDFLAEREAEKRLPAWLSWGAAVYAERFCDTSLDLEAQPGDPWWTRAWSIRTRPPAAWGHAWSSGSTWILPRPRSPASSSSGGRSLGLRARRRVRTRRGGRGAQGRAHRSGPRRPPRPQLVKDLEDAIRSNETALRAFLLG